MSDAPASSPSLSSGLVPSAVRDEPVSLATPWVVGWCLYWLTTFGIFHVVLVPSGFGLYERSFGGGLHYFAMACLGALIFRRELRRPGPPGAIGWGPPGVLVGVGLLALGVSAWVNTIPLGEEAAARYHALQLGVARLDGRYFTGKLPELLFQQAMIYVLVQRIVASGRTGLALCGAFALVFAGLHVPLVVIKGWAGIPFVVLSACAALVFPPLISRFPGGVAYSFAVHLSTYLALGALIRLSPW